ncbi:LysR family transcriptional regulator [Paenibacillus aceris]|nr:LysR family transcriptional regulator [Paenibacillus aceris]
MTLYQLEVFLAVVKTGSFTKAGELLLASQSGVSHTIADLEKEIGALLFSRSRKGISLTETGEQIVIHAREIVKQMEKINQIAAAAKGIQNSTIRIGSFPSFSTNVIPGIFQAFRNRFPSVDLLLFDGSYTEIEAWIKSGVVDLGFLSNPCDGIEIKQLIRDPLVAVLPTNHPLAKQDVISIEQLEHEPFLLLKSGCEDLVISAFQEKAISFNTQFEVADNATIISMVEAGIGVTIVPSLILPINPVNVVVKQLNPPIIREVGWAILSQQIVPPIIAAFIKETQSWLEEAGF